MSFGKQIKGYARHSGRLAVRAATGSFAFCIPLVFAFFSSAAFAICPYSSVSGKAYDLSNPDDLLAVFGQWDRQLVASYLQKPTSADVPKALPRFTYWDQLRTRINLFRTGPEVREQAPKTAQAMATHGISASEGVQMVANALASFHFGNRISHDVGKQRFDDIQNSWLNLLAGIGHGNVPFSQVSAFTKGWNDKVNQVRAEGGAAFLKDEASVEKAGFDAFAMWMLARIAGKSPPSMESVYALSLLHPITDNAIDSGANVGKSMQKLTKLLEGEAVVPETEYERVVFRLVNQILTDFPPSTHPEVRATLLALQQEQLKSALLQKTNATDEERIENTLRKGALTALLFGQLSFGKLDAGQTEYFYRAGSMLQLVDDLLDVSSDLKEGNHTVWTMAHQRNRGDLNDPMRRLMKSQKELEEAAPLLLKDLPNQQAFQNSFNLAFQMFVYSSTFDPAVAKGTRSSLGSRLPLPPKDLKQAVFDILGDPAKLPESTKPPMKILDTGFLGGKYFASGTEGQSKGKGIDIAGSHANPIWWWVRLTDFVHRDINSAYRAGRPLPPWVPLVAVGYATDIIYQSNRVGGITPILAIVAGFQVKKLMEQNPRAGLWASLGLLISAHAAHSLSDWYWSLGDDDRKKAKEELEERGIPEPPKP